MAKKVLRRLSFQELMAAAKGQFEVDIDADLQEAQKMDDAARTAGILTKSELPTAARDSYTQKLEERIAALEAASGVKPVEVKAQAKTEEAEPGPEEDEEKPVEVKAETAPAVTSELVTAFTTGVNEIKAMKAEMALMAAQLAQSSANLDAAQKEIAKLGKKRVEAGTASPLTPEMIAFLEVQASAQKSAEELFPFDSVKE